LTGDASFLTDAVYWARTGLPFVYVWNEVDRPDMMGATIPVFGGTSYVLSWLAVAVQWNGLVYSSALFDLAEFDQSFPWERVGDNILRSAMYQQETAGERFGQWPDAVNFIPGRKGLHGQTPPCFRPGTILRQTYRRLGQRMTPALVTVRQGDQHLALRAVGTFGDPEWRQETLRFTVTTTPVQRGAIEVFGTAKPRLVTVNGKAIHFMQKPWSTPTTNPVWTWHEEVAVVEVRIPQSGTHTVVLTGARRIVVDLAPEILQKIDFDFAASTHDWQASHDLTALKVTPGMITSETTGEDPYMVRGSLFVEGRPGDVLAVTVSSSGGGERGAGIFWGIASSPGFVAARQHSFTIVADDKLRTYRIPIGARKDWANQYITALRLDPGSGAAGCRIAVKTIRLERRTK